MNYLFNILILLFLIGAGDGPLGQKLGKSQLNCPDRFAKQIIRKTETKREKMKRLMNQKKNKQDDGGSSVSGSIISGGGNTTQHTVTDGTETMSVISAFDHKTADAGSISSTQTDTERPNTATTTTSTGTTSTEATSATSASDGSSTGSSSDGSGSDDNSDGGGKDYKQMADWERKLEKEANTLELRVNEPSMLSKKLNRWNGVGPCLRPQLVKRLEGENIVDMSFGKHHGLARTIGGDLFAWGRNVYGQLGTGEGHRKTVKGVTCRQRDPTPRWESPGEAVMNKHKAWSVPRLISSLPVEELVVEFSAGIAHSAVLSDKGNIFVFGGNCGEMNVLGLGLNDKEVHRTPTYSGIQNNMGDGRKPLKSTGEYVHAVVPTRLPLLSKLGIKMISCGAMHTVCVTKMGNAYSWGCGDGGRLGHGPNCETKQKPTQIQSLKGELVIEVKCNSWCSAAIVCPPPLIDCGYIYTWGTSRHGQLGQGHGVHTSTYPKMVIGLSEKSILVKTMDIGPTHSAIIDSFGKVWTWGSTRHLGLGRARELKKYTETYITEPGPIDGLQGWGKGPVTSIACGINYTILVTSSWLGLSEDDWDAEQERIAMVRNVC